MTEEKVEKLQFFLKLSYGFGHFLNDLVATIWFSYTLLFLKDVCQISTAAGPLLTLGQISDAMFTTFIGVFIDLYSTKRNWHLLGSILLTISFPSIFMMHTNILPYWAYIFYLVLMILISQCGWPMTQIAHLAIIPEITSNEKERKELNAIRYSISAIGNITVFILTFMFIRIGGDDVSMVNDEIGPKDFDKFKVRKLILKLF